MPDINDIVNRYTDLLAVVEARLSAAQSQYLEDVKGALKGFESEVANLADAVHLGDLVENNSPGRSKRERFGRALWFRWNHQLYVHCVCIKRDGTVASVGHFTASYGSLKKITKVTP